MPVTSSYFDLPPGPELAWRNRRIIAARIGWPAGALEACEAVEKARPDWDPYWRDGFYATRRGPRTRGEQPVYGADAAALLAAIEAVVSCCPACGLRFPVPAESHLPLHEVLGAGGRCDVHWSKATVAVRSDCPNCRTTLDVPTGSDVPPHQVDGKWCWTRCSQRTV
jgi:hypothetical protein